MKKNILACCLILALCAALFSACGATAAAEPSVGPQPTAEPAAELTAELTEEPVVLTVAGGWPDCRALDEAARDFTELYPNCTVVYEYLQDYYASLEKRMTGEAPVDLFFTTNIQAESPLLPYALDLNAQEGLDLSETFDGLIENFSFREEGGENTRLFAIPLGAEMRGLYVNVTLLKSLGLEVPTDQASLLGACAVLRDNGYIPFHGNPGGFSQHLLYPWVCSLIVHADDPQAAWTRVNSREAGLTEMFRAPCEFLYTLVEEGYYDYKRAQTELGLFIDSTDEAYARDFLNIRQQGDAWEKADDLGQVAFLPSPMSLLSVMDKTRDDYHSGIEYVFIPAPVGPAGGYAYLSPAHGIAVNAASPSTDWAVRFLNFLFQPEHNTAFAAAFHVIPNTREAFSYITSLYDVPDDHISQLGQVTFDYGFYEAMVAGLTDISKANNPKYMQDDGAGGVSLYPLDYYMEALETGIRGQ